MRIFKNIFFIFFFLTISVNFLNLINPIIEKYMNDNSIHILLDKKNVFIANKDYDITNNLIELINNQIKTIDIK